MSFSLSNPSKNLTEYIAQLNRLSWLTKGDCSFEECSGPSLTVKEDFLVSGKSIPAGIKGRLIVNNRCGFPNPLTEFTISKIQELIYEDDDPVFQGYVKKYCLTDVNTFVIVYDLSAVNLQTKSLSFILSSIDELTDTSTVVILVTGKGAPEPVQLNQRDQLDTKAKIRLTPVLEWGLVVKLASVCKNHILANTATSTLCAKYKPVKEFPRKVWSPVPAVDGSSPDIWWFGIKMPASSSRMFDCIYYINMDKRTDRREHMERQLKKFNLAAIRVMGVDGKELAWHDNLGPQTKFWNPGALGYCLSYQNAMIDAIKNNYQRVFIMDDDAVLTDNFMEILNKAYDSLSDDWHLLYLAANHSKDSMPTATERIGEHLFRMKGSVGSHALIINRPAFETILNYASTPYGPLDVYLSVYQQICPSYITYPGLATQLAGVSDIINKEIDYSKDWGVDYINHIAYLKNDVKKS